MARQLPALSMSYSGHFWMAWPSWGVQRAGNLQGIEQGIFVAESVQYGLNLVQREIAPAPIRSTDSFLQPRRSQAGAICVRLARLLGAGTAPQYQAHDNERFFWKIPLARCS